MSVYKEMGFAVSEIFSKSVQIFPDSCDHGVPVKSFDDPIITLIKSMKDLYRLETKTETYSTGSTQTMEFDGGWPAVIEAGFETATIKYITVRGHKDLKGYVTVDVFTSESARKKANSYDY